MNYNYFYIFKCSLKKLKYHIQPSSSKESFHILFKKLRLNYIRTYKYYIFNDYT